MAIALLGLKVKVKVKGRNAVCGTSILNQGQFLPRDALLSAVYAVVVCLSVCLSVCLCVCVCHTPVLYQNGKT